MRAPKAFSNLSLSIFKFRLMQKSVLIILRRICWQQASMQNYMLCLLLQDTVVGKVKNVANCSCHVKTKTIFLTNIGVQYVIIKINTAQKRPQLGQNLKSTFVKLKVFLKDQSSRSALSITNFSLACLKGIGTRTTRTRAHSVGHLTSPAVAQPLNQNGKLLKRK